jgi:predicted RNA-binding protein YlqC (UPF0109 family)
LALGMLQPQGSLNIGSIVEAECEPGDGEFVEATIKAIDVGTGQLTLQFANSLVRSNVAFSEIRMPIAGQVTSSDDDLYILEVAGDLPTAPTTEELTNDGEAKYAYVQRYKDVGNALFKAGKYAWAIRTYVDAVNSLSARCYKSREYMMLTTLHARRVASATRTRHCVLSSWARTSALPRCASARWSASPRTRI